MSKDQLKQIETIEKELKEFSTDWEKRKYLYRCLANTIQAAIKEDDESEGKNDLVYKWLRTELRFMRIMRKSKQTNN
jgi:hypothetical protein